MTNFDERAATWDENPGTVERATAVANAIRDAVTFDGTQRVFEYGAGTGLVTQALGRAVGSATLADTSEGMRDVMLAKIESGVLANAEVSDIDLETAPVPDDRFDVIVTALTLHHVGDVPTVLSKFADLLVDGGHVCIADLEKEDGSFHGEGADVHHGFDRDELTADLTAAGFTNIKFRDCHFIERDTGTFPVFLATARHTS